MEAPRTVLLVCMVMIRLDCHAKAAPAGNGTDYSGRSQNRLRRQLPPIPNNLLPQVPFCPAIASRDHGQWDVPSVDLYPIQLFCGVSTPYGKRDIRDLFKEDLKISKRIVGGTASASGQWPWLVSILKLGQHICTGTLISRRWVLTAAHCFNEWEVPCHIMVQVGEKQILNRNSNIQLLPIDRLIRHRDYVGSTPNDNINTGYFYYDVALIRLAADIIPSNDANPACLPSIFEPYDPYRCHIAGWGDVRPGGKGETMSPTLLHTAVGLIDIYTCSQITGPDPIGMLMFGKICIANNPGHDACHGDSGGPLLCPSTRENRWIVVGVVSHGTSPTGCGTSSWLPGLPVYTPYGPMINQGYPTVFTDVAYNMGWIQAMIIRNGGA